MARILLLSFVIILAAQSLPTVHSFARFAAKGAHRFEVDEHGGAIDPRIMGGTMAAHGQFPFQVAVYASLHPTIPEVFCGGSLISPTAVLTAAHCVQNFTYFDVVLGTTRPLQANSAGRVQIKTTNVKIHKDFNFGFGLDNDIALLILPYSCTLTPSIQPIVLPKRSQINELFIQPAITSGWGKIGDVPGFVNEDLLYVQIDIIDNEYCIRSYGPDYVPPTKMCISTAGGTKGPCHGDSGGPLFLTFNGERLLVGIVSFGAKAGCESGFPDVYTRTTSFLDWIAANGGPAVRP